MKMELNEMEDKDRRNQFIRNKARAISGEILHWLLMAGAWICIFLLVGVFLLKTITDLILMAYYQHKI